MNKRFMSRFLFASLMIAVPGHALMAQNSEKKEQNSRLESLKSSLKSFNKSVRSYARCVATGECDSEHQKKIVGEIGSLAKKIVTAVIFLGVVYGTSRIVGREADRVIEKAGSQATYQQMQAEERAGRLLNQANVIASGQQAQAQQRLRDTVEGLQKGLSQAEVTGPGGVVIGRLKLPTEAEVVAEYRQQLAELQQEKQEFEAMVQNRLQGLEQQKQAIENESEAQRRLRLQLFENERKTLLKAINDYFDRVPGSFKSEKLKEIRARLQDELSN